MDDKQWNRMVRTARLRSEVRGVRQAIVGTESATGGTHWCIVPADRKERAKQGAAYTAKVLRDWSK